MNQKQDTVTEHDLHALVDGQLPRERMSLVQAYLDQHPDEAQKVASWTLQRNNLKAMFDPVVHEKIPDSLLLQQGRNESPRFFIRIAAVIAWLAVGLVSGWWLHGVQSQSILYASTPAFVNLAAMAHVVYTPEVRHPVEVNASEEQHLVKWLSKRLKGNVQIPQFNDAGYMLVGGRLLPGVDSAAAHFMYENTQGERLTLYVSQTDKQHNETAFHYTENQGNSLFYWIDPEFAYVLVGQMPRESLLKLAHQVYQQLGESPS